MGNIVNRFEAAIESYPVAADAQHDTTLSYSSVTDNLDDIRMDQTQEDRYYRREFKSSAVKVSNDRSSKHNDDSPTHEDDVDDKHFMKTKHGN